MRLAELIAQLGGLASVCGTTDTLEIGRVEALEETLVPVEGAVYLCANPKTARRWLEANASHQVRACLIGPRSFKKVDWPTSGVVVLDGDHQNQQPPAGFLDRRPLGGNFRRASRPSPPARVGRKVRTRNLRSGHAFLPGLRRGDLEEGTQKLAQRHV
jgi:hypothetical protein